ncbi:protein abrupt-like isoform X1 [Amphibalanus amphitrite]|uniref:protein abrupt-like isoform X1 n=1 Tax=Amphibalanus amphitrite TaxID=1232801 RepID=UPI001C91DC3F|nr:protein abrupt-like isoform X1 [Amphibalanus amphitrite]XP_043235306.1 protein abrupt-like isoform X1 [Amphibalanus amphitrite]XP_043235307.1 protein abrupt-like isoform X1 [Amphibalanus amphitrite]
MPDHYLLQWSNHLTNIAAAFSTLRQNSKLVDVTLAADGRSIQAHKVVLCACSAYFEELLSINPCKHPIVYLKDVQHEHLSAVVEFMYSGAVYVGNEHLDDVLSLGASLRVRGMVDVKGAGSSSRQGSNDENKDPDTPASKKRKRRPGLSRDNSSEEPAAQQVTVLTRDPSVDQDPGVVEQLPAPAQPGPMETAATSAAAAASAAPSTSAPEQPMGKPATVPTAAERKAAPPRSYSEGDMGLKGKDGLDAEDGSSPRAKRCLLQRQPRVKRECDQPVGGGSADEPHGRPPPLSQQSASVETLVSDTPPAAGGPYLAVPTGSYWPVRQMSTPTPVLSTREGTLVKQGSMPSMACVPQPSSSPATIQKQRSTPVLSRGGSGPPAYFVVGGSSATPLMPVVVSQSQSVPQILLTSADEAQPPSERSPSCRSHAPVLRDGPAVSCSHCWNTEYSQGRTLRRKTKYMCRDCSVSLCIVPCFQEYHETVSKSPLVVTRDPNKPLNKKILPKLGSL